MEAFAETETHWLTGLADHKQAPGIFLPPSPIFPSIPALESKAWVAIPGFREGSGALILEQQAHY